MIDIIIRLIDKIINLELAIITVGVLYLLVEFTLYHWTILFTALAQ
tara:strand:- start:556 stop:693 length:138 start_codon:yes stop_codon:yes gene_type:complete